MPILLGLVVLFFPRLLLVYLKFFTAWFTTVDLSLIWLILGFIFMPFTLLWYSAVQNWFGGNWGTLQVVIMVAAVLTDLGGGFGATRKRS